MKPINRFWAVCIDTGVLAAFALLTWSHNISWWQKTFGVTIPIGVELLTVLITVFLFFFCIIRYLWVLYGFLAYRRNPYFRAR